MLSMKKLLGTTTFFSFISENFKLQQAETFRCKQKKNIGYSRQCFHIYHPRQLMLENRHLIVDLKKVEAHFGSVVKVGLLVECQAGNLNIKWVLYYISSPSKKLSLLCLVLSIWQAIDDKCPVIYKALWHHDRKNWYLLRC